MTDKESFLKDIFGAVDETSKLIDIEKFTAYDSFIVVIRIKIDKDFPAKCREWVKKFCDQTNSKYLVVHTWPNAKRMAYRMKFSCKMKNSKGCPSKIDLKVKKITEHTVKKDPFLKAGWNTIIKVNFQHNHER